MNKLQKVVSNFVAYIDRVVLEDEEQVVESMNSSSQRSISSEQLKLQQAHQQSKTLSAHSLTIPLLETASATK